MPNGGNFFARLHASDKRLIKRSCETLLGVCAGILADGVLNEKELFFLDQWLREHDEIAERWPASEIALRVHEVIAHGHIMPADLDHLKTVLIELIGNTVEETGTASSEVPTKLLPFDDICDVKFADRNFCLTGEFIFGPRDKCEKAIQARGGNVLSGIRQNLNYLVVGTLVSKEWKHSSFGTKIEKAIEYRKNGIEISIISETRWSSFVRK